ncbi:MAG: tRNA (adenosine(37)-N6)-dimethylallyltransferase MiaA [Ignavibacteria bacterium]|nr:tRNA (adenosine(37)-N6)-dimethylallyltransferase MiaA [Ignavibacteria bacterium]
MAGKPENKRSLPEVIVVTGPTASGKTPLSLQLAEKIKKTTGKDVEIISADSRQVYRHFPITSAQPTNEELKMFRHHFINELEPEVSFNAGMFGKLGRELIESIFNEGKVPLVVGGSGLYVNSLVYGLFEYEEDQNVEIDAKQAAVRAELYGRLEKNGLPGLIEELKKVDIETFDSIKEFTDRRVIRALEVFYVTGIPVSEHRKRKIDINFNPKLYAVEMPRDELYDRINRRAGQMLASGMIEEISALKEKGYHYKTHNSLNTVGAREVFEYLNGKITAEEMIELIKQNTRRFAKRQMTWFRRDENIKWIASVDEVETS